MYLITGSTGLLGSALCNELDRQGTEHVCATRDKVDLSDNAATHAFFEDVRPNVVLHTAARVHGLMGNKRFPAEIFEDNLSINYNVLTAARAIGAEKVVVASTVAAYPGHLSDNINEDQYLAGPPHDGESAYAHAKRAMLAQLEAYKTQYGSDYAYAIFTNLYGPRDRFDTENGHVVPSLIAKFHASARDGVPVRIWGRGRAKRDFLYVADAAAAMIHLVDHRRGPINIATGTTVPIARVVDILSDVSGVSDVVWEHDKPEGQLDRSYDVGRLRETGFTHQYRLREGLKLTYDWYVKNYPDVRA